MDLSSFTLNVYIRILTSYFTLVGTSIWHGSETDFFILGAISGALFATVVIKYSPPLCGKTIDVIRGNLSRERMDPALLNALEIQLDGVEMNAFTEVENIFDVGGGAEGLSEDSVEKIPKITVTSGYNVDTSGETISCSVCLEDFEVGETVRSLPHYHHMFHIPCIDMWLINHGSCHYAEGTCNIVCMQSANRQNRFLGS